MLQGGNDRAIDDTPVASAEPALEQPFPEEYAWAFAERGLDAEQDGFREALSNLTTKNPLDGLQHVAKVVLFEPGWRRGFAAAVSVRLSSPCCEIA